KSGLLGLNGSWSVNANGKEATWKIRNDYIDEIDKNGVHKQKLKISDYVCNPYTRQAILEVRTMSEGGALLNVMVFPGLFWNAEYTTLQTDRETTFSRNQLTIRKIMS